MARFLKAAWQAISRNSFEGIKRLLGALLR
jgi:hypothetical protein